MLEESPLQGRVHEPTTEEERYYIINDDLQTILMLLWGLTQERASMQK